MKSICALFMSGIVTLCFSLSVAAQSAQQDLDQIELMNQLVGTWECELAQDTIRTIEFKSFGSGLVYTSNTKADEKIISEGMSIMGYDNANDKLFQCLIFNTSPNVYNLAWWFTSPTKCTIINYAGIHDPENTPILGKCEFVSSDVLVETHYLNGEVIETTSWHRINE